MNDWMGENAGVDYLLGEYKGKNVIKTEKLFFNGVGNKDVYNITSPFRINGIDHIAGRVESRESETDSKTMFFVRENGDQGSKNYILDKNAQILDLQDPFFCATNDEIVLGGVELFFDKGKLNYRTRFYKGPDLSRLESFACGPDGMKDIRLISIRDEICIFTRPQGPIGGRGRIGFMTIGSIDYLPRLKAEQYLSAPLLNNEIDREAWLGANQILLLKNGTLGVLGHIAHFSEGSKKNYYPIAFQFNAQTKKASKMEVIARAQDLPGGNPKRKELANVLYPGGLARLGNGEAKLYAGARDSEAYEITIKDPFLKYE